MGKKFLNKYRIESNRMPGWNYAGDGTYFITIVTQNRIHWFGEIKNGKMLLSRFGDIVDDEFIKSFKIRNELYLNEYIIMPNHLHAIVTLKKTEIIIHSNELNNYDDLHEFQNFNEFNDLMVETHSRVSLPSNQFKSTKSIEPVFKRQPKSISSFIAGFKSATINKINNFIDENNLKIKKFNKTNHLWQPNYYDHIIRNKTEYFRIKNYIINNPLKWKGDKLNTK